MKRPERKPSSNKRRWSKFRHRYIERTWFDYGRTKTRAAMRKLFEQVPCDVLAKLPRITVIAPAPGTLGGVSTFGRGNRVVLFLSADLEKFSQREVDFTVAHEFAHVVLNHCEVYERGRLPRSSVMRKRERTAERDADRLAESWGFQRPKGRRR